MQRRATTPLMSRKKRPLERELLRQHDGTHLEVRVFGGAGVKQLVVR